MIHFRTLMAASSVLALAGLGAFAWQQKKPLPPPDLNHNVRNNPRVIPQPENAKINLPQGFSASVWAEGFQTPRFLLQGRDGEILLSDSNRQGVVWVFPKGDPNAKKQLITGIDRPYGLAIHEKWLYVGTPAALLRYTYDSKALTVGEAETIVSWPGFDKGGHWTRSLLFDRAGKKIYVGLGSASNVDAGEPPARAAINRYNPDGSGHEVFASGTRNPIGIHWYPGTDTLWAAVQERDGIGDDLVPDYFTRIQQGKFYGWPFAYAGPNEDPRRKGENPELVAKTVQGDVLLGSHVAVLDFTFYTGKMFPKEYQGGAFLAFHGSWNRAKRVGYSVVFIPFAKGMPSGEQRDFMTGFMLSPDEREVWGRPVAVFQMLDGSLLVTDDGGKKIWRIKYGAGS